MATIKRAWWISYPLRILLGLQLLLSMTACTSPEVSAVKSVDIPAAEAPTESVKETKTQVINNVSATRTPIITPSRTPTDVPSLLPTATTQPIKENQFTPLFGFPIPSPGSDIVEPTYRFGSTQFGEKIPHDGVEMINPEGTPVVAAAPGKVVFAGNDRTFKRGRFTNFYGNIIILEHKFENYSVPVYSFYAHLSEILVNQDDVVSQGQLIGRVGATGKAFTNHLHFEVRIGDILLQNARNPELFLPLLPSNDGIGSGVLIGALRSIAGNPIPGASVVIQKIVDGQIQSSSSIYVETYSKTSYGDEHWNENFVVSNLPAGEYRVSAYAYQYFLEKFITINADEYTFVNLQAEE